MLEDIDLRQLAELTGPERAFVSLYLSGPDALQSLDNRIAKVRGLLSGEPAEVEHFEENLKRIQEWLAEHRFGSESLCVFSCWALDYLEHFPLDVKVPDVLWVDSSPYIRPLAELQAEYEKFVVVAADNKDTRIYLVTSEVLPEEHEARVKGDIKNHVKKGGWSQKRYARRRSNELLHYAKEVAEVLAEMEQKEGFARILLLGSQETIAEIKSALPTALAEKVVGEKPVDLGAGTEQVFDEAFDLYFAEERASEERLWERIQGEYLRGGLAVAGPEDVLLAAQYGRVEAMIVTRDAKIAGTQCRDCEELSAGERTRCPECRSESVFKVDLVNELAQILALTGAEAEFADPLPGLSEVGDVAALLRY
ncbi:MAG TPA: Vms1/Ankzf1 family peptidyl-tRNA hydrolase [Thermoanaerobaculia bacterium]|jgi:peptide chain release factor subunit 1|nr:Vms1/Ankzf1 family peptidyl-tRNA hydrolase [Thermoanaerobaculia bacterium]